MSHTIFHTHHLSHTIFCTQLCHTPSLTLHLSHTTLSHTIFRHTIFHTPLCHTPSFTHHLSPHHLSHTTLSHTIFHHTIFHTPLCHTPSFTTPSFTHHFVTHHLSHTTLSHTIFHTQLCHTLSKLQRQHGEHTGTPIHPAPRNFLMAQSTERRAPPARAAQWSASSGLLCTESIRRGGREEKASEDGRRRWAKRYAVFCQCVVALEGRKVGSLKRRVRSHLVR